MANIFEEYGLDLIVNQSKLSRRQETLNGTPPYINELDKQMKKTFQILQNDILSSEIVSQNFESFAPYIRKYVTHAIQKFEKEYSNKYD